MPALVSQQVANTSDSWAVRDVPASQHRLTLTRLDPGSLYEVEMAAHNCAGEGQTAMVTFRTGKGRTFPWVFCWSSGQGPSLKSHLSPEAPGLGQRGCFLFWKPICPQLRVTPSEGNVEGGTETGWGKSGFSSAWKCLGVSPFIPWSLSWTPAEP